MLALALGLLACSHSDEDRLRMEVQALTLARGEAARTAAARLGQRGLHALPPIESALHGADEAGRRNLVVALQQMGAPEAVPILLHLAAYDAEAAIRTQAEALLLSWATADKDHPVGTADPGSNSPASIQALRAERARAALRRLDELRDREEAG